MIRMPRYAYNVGAIWLMSWVVAFFSWHAMMNDDFDRYARGMPQQLGFLLIVLLLSWVLGFRARMSKIHIPRRVHDLVTLPMVWGIMAFFGCVVSSSDSATTALPPWLGWVGSCGLLVAGL